MIHGFDTGNWFEVNATVKLTYVNSNGYQTFSAVMLEEALSRSVLVFCQ